MVGAWLAANGHSMVFGGATGGMMSSASEAFRRVLPHPFGEQRLIGVVTEHISRSGRRAGYCDDLHVVGSMAERKQMMRELADCFVCLPGSYGTLDEMFDVIGSGTVGEHDKPLIILSYKDFYKGLQIETARMKELHFLPEQERYSPIFVNTMDELFATLNNLKP
jgi:hypothetical protein